MNVQPDLNFHGLITTFSFFHANAMTLDKLIEHFKEDRIYESMSFEYLLFANNGFHKDSKGHSIVDLLTLEKDADNLFKEVLTRYEEQFKTIPPKKWDFISLQNKNKCHDILLDFYGTDYFESIFDLNKNNISLYSRDYSSKYYFSNKLDHKINIDNLKHFYEHNCNILHTLVFLEKDKENFKNFIIDSAKSEETKKSSKGLLFSNLLYKHNKQVYDFGGSPESIIIELKLHLPKEDDLNILIDNWGINKTSEIISEYFKLQEEYITFNKIPFTKVTLDRNKLMKLIDYNINFIDCGKTLALGLKFEPQLLSYFLITDVIKKEQLLTHIQEDSLQIRVNHHMLQNTLSTNAVPKKKIKL
jgi:hypothetical protein